MSVLKITVTSDESILYEIDGKHVIDSDHGPHGWEGMEDIDKAMRNVAGILGLEVIVDETIERMPI